MEIKIGSIIRVYGQTAEVAAISPTKIYLENSIVVPTVEYTKDWCYEEEIDEVLT
jgi:hypothetical protein